MPGPDRERTEADPALLGRRAGDRHVLAMVGGLVVFLATLWLGVAVWDDGPLRSALVGFVASTIATFGIASAGNRPRDVRNR